MFSTDLDSDIQKCIGFFFSISGLFLGSIPCCFFVSIYAVDVTHGMVPEKSGLECVLSPAVSARVER